MVENAKPRTRVLIARVFLRPSVREALYGYLFAMPGILGFLFFVAGPLVASVYFSLTDYSVGGTPTYVGLSNYRYALTKDELFFPSFGRTFYYIALTVPLGIGASLLLAMLLNQGLAGTTLFRALFFLPSLTPSVAMVFLWAWIFHPNLGPINYFLWEAFKIQGPRWMASTEWAIPSLAIIALWAAIGGNRMLIFLAGLQNIPEELYDAAKIDGANAWHRFWRVTLPMLSPTIFFIVVLSIIGALRVFETAYVGTQGGPARATWFMALHIYTNAFSYFEMGYASALAWMFAALVLALTLVQFRLSRRWVYYAGEVS